MVDTVEREKPVAVGISGLISLVASLVRQVRPLLKERKLEQVKIIAGGAALKQLSPEWLNVDYVAESAFDGADFIAGIARRRSQ